MAFPVDIESANTPKKLIENNMADIVQQVESPLKPVYTIQILLTNFCNLHCTYCYVKRKPLKTISCEAAEKAILELLKEYPPEIWRYEICFMGGEPLSEFRKIQTISQWIWDTFPEMEVHISSPTNGTLLNEEMRTWFTENREKISLSLSYDGESAQNTNRSQSASLIDPDFFRRLWPYQPFKMTVSEDNVESLARDIVDLQERGCRIAANAACGEPPWKENNILEFGRQMEYLAQYYVDHPEKELIDLISVDIRQVLLYQEPMRRRCGIGYHYSNIDMDGNLYPCHMFSPLALNAEQLEKAEKYNMSQREDFSVPSCQACILNPICPRCYGMSYIRFGDPFAVDPNLCRLFHLQVKAACTYHIKRMARLEQLSENDQVILCAIRLIVETFSLEI